MRNVIIAAMHIVTAWAAEDAFKAPETYPEGELGKMIQLGETIATSTNTHPLTKAYVGNDLTCVNCHLPGEDNHVGTSKGLGSFIGTAAAFPAYSSRNGAVITLQDRVNECFLRSMNAKKPITDTKGSMALTAYIAWLSSGTPMNPNGEKPSSAYNTELLKQRQHYKKMLQKATHANYENGAKVYANKCSMCHGTDGEGMPDMPPLWGKDKAGKWRSYNAGAGMSKPDQAALWIKTNMPYKSADTLSDQEACDVSLYINAQSRESFAPRDDQLPKNFIGYSDAELLGQFSSVEMNFKALSLDLMEIKKAKK